MNAHWDFIVLKIRQALMSRQNKYFSTILPRFFLPVCYFSLSIFYLSTDTFFMIIIFHFSHLIFIIATIAVLVQIKCLRNVIAACSSLHTFINCNSFKWCVVMHICFGHLIAYKSNKVHIKIMVPTFSMYNCANANLHWTHKINK